MFCGNMSAKYKQIGNAVPVNLAWAIGRSLIRLLNKIEIAFPQNNHLDSYEYMPVNKLHGLFEGMACDRIEEYGIK